MVALQLEWMEQLEEIVEPIVGVDRDYYVLDAGLDHLVLLLKSIMQFEDLVVQFDDLVLQYKGLSFQFSL